MASTVAPSDASIEHLHGSGGPEVVAINPDGRALFSDAADCASHSALVDKLGSTFHIDRRESDDALMACVGVLKSDTAPGEMSREDSRRARLVFAELTGDSNTGHSCRLVAGFLNRDGIAPAHLLNLSGEFAPLLQVHDWRRVQWELRLLDFHDDGTYKLDTDLNIVRRRILCQLLDLADVMVPAGWGDPARKPSGRRH